MKKKLLMTLFTGLESTYQEETSKHDEMMEKSKEEVHNLASIIEKVRKKLSEELYDEVYVLFCLTKIDFLHQRII